MSKSSPWLVDRRDFLKTSSAAVFGLMAGRASLSNGGTTSGPEGCCFGVITDMHFADAPTKGSSTRYYRQSLDKTREAVSRLRSHNPAFLAILGDMKDTVSGEADTKTLLYLVAVEAENRRFGGPTYHVLGNHDMDNLSKKQVLSAITNTGIATGRAYYAFSRGGIRFITLDACCKKDGTDYDHNNFDWKDTYVPAPQLDFLRSELKTSSEPVIVFVHQRLDGTAAECIRNAAEVRTTSNPPARSLPRSTDTTTRAAIRKSKAFTTTRSSPSSREPARRTTRTPWWRSSPTLRSRSPAIAGR